MTSSLFCVWSRSAVIAFGWKFQSCGLLSALRSNWRVQGDVAGLRNCHKDPLQVQGRGPIQAGTEGSGEESLALKQDAYSTARILPQ